MKSFLLPIFLLALFVSGCTANDPEAEMMKEAKKTLFEGCKKTGSKLPGMTQRQITSFCTCSTEKTITLLGTEGVRNLRKSGDFSESNKLEIKKITLQCSASMLK
jgi:hypothetical protein